MDSELKNLIGEFEKIAKETKKVEVVDENKVDTSTPDDSVQNLMSELSTAFKESKKKITPKKIKVEQSDLTDFFSVIKEAKKEIRKFAQIKRDEAYTKALRDREFIFIKAKSAFKNGGDLNALRLALDTVKDREKFQDLYKEKENPTVINKNIDMNQLTEKQLEALAKGKSIEEVLAIKE